MLLDMTPLTYQANGALHAQRLADLPGMVFLDSRHGAESHAGWDFIAALPEATLCIEDYGHDAQRWLAAIEEALRAGAYPGTPEGWPFGLGAIGFFDYDSAARIHGIQRANPFPAKVGLYRAAVVQNHAQGEAWLVCDPQCPPEKRSLLIDRLSMDPVAPCEPAGLAAASLIEPFTPDISEQEYRDALARIQAWLHAGDCYQVNFAHRFHARMVGHAWCAYRQLRKDRKSVV